MEGRTGQLTRRRVRWNGVSMEIIPLREDEAKGRPLLGMAIDRDRQRLQTHRANSGECLVWFWSSQSVIPETSALPAELQRPFLDYSRAARQKDEPTSRHAGEIATVLMAAHLGAGVIVIDDLFGKRLARDRGVPRLSTAQLAAEMVAEGQLTDDGYRAFDLSTPSEAGRADFIRACDRARAARG